MQRFIYAYYVVIALLAAIMLGLVFGQYGTAASAREDDQRNQVIGLLDAVRANLFDPEGARIYYIESDIMKHVISGDSVNSGHVNLHYVTDDDAKIIIKSDSAEIFSKGRFIKLRGKVVIEKFTPDFEVEQSVLTEDVLINTKDQRAVSSAPVTVQQAQQLILGEGLEANLVTGKIKLLRNIRVNNNV